MNDSWNSGDPYEYFMGRWSSLMAPVFLNWLNHSPDKKWIDLGCGTGALSQAIEQYCSPQSLTCVDPSEAFLEKSKKRISANATFIRNLIGGKDDPNSEALILGDTKGSEALERFIPMVNIYGTNKRYIDKFN